MRRRLLFVKGMISIHKCTLVNIYSKNEVQITFLERTVEHLDRFAEGILLIGGDINTALNPLVDTTSTSAQLSTAKLNRLKNTHL